MNFNHLLQKLSEDLDSTIDEFRSITQKIDRELLFDSRSLLLGVGIDKSKLPLDWLKDGADGSTVSCYARNGNKTYFIQATRKVLPKIGHRYEIMRVEQVQKEPPFNPFDTNTGSKIVTKFRDLLGW